MRASGVLAKPTSSAPSSYEYVDCDSLSSGPRPHTGLVEGPLACLVLDRYSERIGACVMLRLTAAEPSGEACDLGADDRVRGWELGAALRERSFNDLLEIVSAATSSGFTRVAERSPRY